MPQQQAHNGNRQNNRGAQESHNGADDNTAHQKREASISQQKSQNAFKYAHLKAQP